MKSEFSQLTYYIGHNDFSVWWTLTECSN
uniref:Uncharacterized protein n=1 Tax=Anguilla anguilla TaxID=7936 RepID=A0A0E9S4D2_ANGAN